MENSWKTALINGVTKSLTALGLAGIAYKLFSKAMDRDYSVSASHGDTKISLSPGHKS